ncbi:AAA family ATPase [Lignipirellula cremea]|uniref:ATPase AAA-type core domain-containing protein n=1 Tax=Lignipirellula cremea TaxID=2528010 RepID=A0A518E138_9BACT|nr:ATP-binding protein [Lignipirellula cremea]QDU97817.1 hypothetical protein Pla8534_56740 [Lignipirellula cremea]
MLIEFRVENYRSLRDEQAITFEASNVGDANDPRPRKVPGHDTALLPAVVLYGANASGKSNVLYAMAFMRDTVQASQRFWEPEGGIPRSAFAWGDSAQSPSMLEATFLVDETKYVYGFVVDDEVVKEEWLYSWPKNRKQVWLERDGMQFKFGEHLKGPNGSVKEVTRVNSLYLSAAAQQGHEQLTPIYAWFRGVSPWNVGGRIPNASRRFEIPRGLNLAVKQSDRSLERIQALLSAADFGIVGIRQEKFGLDTSRHFSRFMLQHRSNNEDAWLPLEDESDGTKTLFNLSPYLFDALDTGSLLLVDELESSLHPLLALAIVKMFNSPESNPLNAQLLFTTHDTNLLSPVVGEPPFRRDQIWFTEKDDNGASNLYPLTDFKPRNSENIERGYLQGRYGAIPYLGDMTWIAEKKNG